MSSTTASALVQGQRRHLGPAGADLAGARGAPEEAGEPVGDGPVALGHRRHRQGEHPGRRRRRARAGGGVAHDRRHQAVGALLGHVLTPAVAAVAGRRRDAVGEQLQPAEGVGRVDVGDPVRVLRRRAASVVKA